MISGMTPPFGGVEATVDELSRFLSNRGVKVTVFGRSEKNFVKKNTFYEIVGVRPFNYLPSPIRFTHYHKYAYSFEVWKKLQRERPFDVIHGHGDNCFFPSLFRDDTPFIMTFHGTMKGAYSIFGRKLGPRTMPAFYTEKVAALRCDIAVACSNAVKNELQVFYGASPKKLKVIHNGVDTDKFVPQDKNIARKKLRLHPKYKYGIWVGTNPSLKGLSIAMKALEGLKNVHLLIVGVEGKNSVNLTFLGKVYNHELLLTLYNAADFLIFPTFYEGFPVVPLEAMACGVPIVVSKESNMEEIIKDGIHGFIIKDKNPMMYREKVEQLLSYDKTLEDISIRCRELAIKLSWKKQAEKYWKIYEELTK